MARRRDRFKLRGKPYPGIPRHHYYALLREQDLEATRRFDRWLLANPETVATMKPMMAWMKLIDEDWYRAMDGGLADTMRDVLWDICRRFNPDADTKKKSAER